MNLFKYLPPARIDVLKTRRFRYSQPASFNDPFDAKPYFTGIAPLHLMEAGYAGRYARVLREQYLAMPSDFCKKVPFEIFSKLLEHNREDIYKIFRDVDASFVPAINEVMHKGFRENLGVFSLSELNDSHLMWSHYAASHCGFTIEFDERHVYFTGANHSEDDLWNVKQITYAEQRPHTAASELDIQKILLTKHVSWSYEREWRHFQPLNQACRIIEAQPHSIHLFEIPADAFRSVIFGAKMDTSLRENTISEIRQKSSFQHLRLFDAALGKDDYALVFHEANA